MFRIGVLLFLAIYVSHSFANSSRSSEIAEVFEKAGYVRPADFVIERVRAVEDRYGKKLSDSVLIDLARHVLAHSGGQLKNRRHCFTCNMRVLTPSGYIEIAKIKVGDQVYSWDQLLQTLVLNRVDKIHSIDNQPIGELLQTPTGVPLQVTHWGEFLLPEYGEDVFDEIGKIGESQYLQAIRGDRENCEHFWQAKGAYVAKGRTTVHTFSVANKPYNFVIEGLVVHNKSIDGL